MNELQNLKNRKLELPSMHDISKEKTRYIIGAIMLAVGFLLTPSFIRSEPDKGFLFVMLLLFEFGICLLTIPYGEYWGKMTLSTKHVVWFLTGFIIAVVILIAVIYSPFWRDIIR